MTANKTQDQSTSKATYPSMFLTGGGYEYFRCQANGTDETVYVQQLCAIAAGYDSHEVFSDSTFIRRYVEVPWLNTPENVYLTVNMEFVPPSEIEVHPSERSRAGVPESEYERLQEIALDHGSSEVSRTLQRHMREYQCPGGAD